VTVADLAKPHLLRHDRIFMGQLRTANKRRNRALRAPQTVKQLPKVVRKADSAPIKKPD
jgi:hypothetical protein